MREKIIKILQSSETEDLEAPYRCLPPINQTMVEKKADKIQALFEAENASLRRVVEAVEKIKEMSSHRTSVDIVFGFHSKQDDAVRDAFHIRVGLRNSIGREPELPRVHNNCMTDEIIMESGRGEDFETLFSEKIEEVYRYFQAALAELKKGEG